jgi:twitching motility protein PilT
MTNAPEKVLGAKIYKQSEGHLLSLQDLLEYFQRRGSLRVSDLHLQVGCPPVYRVDGSLQRLKGDSLDRPTMDVFLGALLTETEAAAYRQNGSVDLSLITEAMRYRINCFHDSEGPAIAIRALEPTVLPVEQIGFANQVWRDILKRKQGLVLLTGITGAGKSTTIASMIDRIAQTTACRIITLEDPIEYRLRSQMAVISQRELGRDVPSFERGLRDCLREDPDVIFVGEMRDRESASWTLTAAETGHLVFSTLHTRDVRGTITRVLDMFPSTQQDEVASQLSLGLAYVICQRLIPRRDGKGRLVAMEILNNVYGVSNLIRTRKLEQLYTMLQTRTKDIPEERMITMERSLATLVRDGKIDVLEAEKWAGNASAFLDEMQHVGSDPPQQP